MKRAFLRDEAYNKIREKMVLGQLPAGSEISEPKLAEMLGISRTPVREALQQLEVEGFVERMPRRGTVVRMPSRRDIEDLFELREALESYAVTLATERHTEDDLSMLRSLCREMELIEEKLRKSKRKSLSKPMMKRFVAADIGFHILLIRAARNRPLMRLVSESHVMSRVFETSARPAHTLELIEDANKVHRRILNAVKDYDGFEARRISILHIKQGLREVLDYLGNGQAEAPAKESQVNDMPIPSDVVDEFKRVGLTFKGMASAE